jgi:hypothetical protein
MYQHADAVHPVRLLGLGGERRCEEHRTRASEERAAVDHWVVAQVVCELGAKGCAARSSRVGSMQEPSFQAGASLAVRQGESESVRAGLGKPYRDTVNG